MVLYQNSILWDTHRGKKLRNGGNKLPRNDMSWQKVLMITDDYEDFKNTSQKWHCIYQHIPICRNMHIHIVCLLSSMNISDLNDNFNYASCGCINPISTSSN